MKLYYMPGACSIGIHVILEEIGKPYDLQKIDGAAQEQYGEAFVKLNPKSKVPTLQKDDGAVLTELVTDASGDPAMTLSVDDVKTKFHRHADAVLGKAAAADLAVAALAATKNEKALATLLAAFAR